MERNTVFGILAHVDAGKTTLSEQLLYRAGVLRDLGRVDRQTSFMDHAKIEKDRGITVFSDQADISLHGRPFTLIDTPGHVDFSGEMERCLLVLDLAVLVVSCIEGVQAHTETLWRLLNERGVPVAVFINKTDRDGADTDSVIAQLEKLGGKLFFDLSHEKLSENGFSQELQEFAASCDESLMDKYLDGSDDIHWNEELANLVADRKFIPVFTGSALNGTGVEELMFGISALAPKKPGREDLPFSGRVYQIRHDKSGRVVHLKVEQGTLRAKDIILTADGKSGKCNELRVRAGEKYQPLQKATPGMLCAVTGITDAFSGDTVGEGARRSESFSLRPLLSAQVLYDKNIPASEMLSLFRELEDEEPLLSVTWEEDAGELRVEVMGEIQLEVLQELFSERYSKQINFGPCSVLYEETVVKAAVGCGHFEPLRHYAEVHLLVSPGEKGSGISFESKCPLDDLSRNWQNLVETHVFEKRHRGVLVGAPLTDTKITLLSGRAHLKHTEGGDFREAVYRALRHGLMYAESRLLEPFYSFEISADFNEIGKVQSELQQRGAELEAPFEKDGRMYLTGRAPVRLMMDYPKIFTAFTKGKGRLSLSFDGYDPCIDEKKIIDSFNYEPERDVANTPDSVFCSHGAGFPVKWHEAVKYMHIPVEDPTDYE